MSSEMRELIRKEVEQWVGITRNRDIERSARVWMEGYDAALTYCAERISALLARTEAGADGANLIQWRYTNAETGEVLTPWTECDAAFREKRKDAPGYQFRELFTHPQDASGDAEDAAMFRWLCDNARPWESDYEEPHALIRICRGEFQGGIGWFNIIGRESRVGIITLRDAVRAAMQAKEAK